MTILFGTVYYRRRQFAKAVDEYNRAINIIDTHEKTFNSGSTKEKADAYCLRGTAESQIGNHNEAVRDFNKALKIYKEIYGSHHNKPSALAFGNLGRVYLLFEDKDEADRCFDLALDILNDIIGEKDQDYIRFKNIKEHVSEAQ